MKRIGIIFSTALIACVILFTPSFCKAQTEESSNTDDKTISYLKFKLECLEEEMSKLILMYEGTKIELKDSKKVVQKDLELLMAQLQRGIEAIIEQLDAIIKIDENGS